LVLLVLVLACFFFWILGWVGFSCMIGLAHFGVGLLLFWILGWVGFLCMIDLAHCGVGLFWLIIDGQD
jgi:hypothetical protein